MEFKEARDLVLSLPLRKSKSVFWSSGEGSWVPLPPSLSSPTAGFPLSACLILSLHFVLLIRRLEGVCTLYTVQP